METHKNTQGIKNEFYHTKKLLKYLIFGLQKS